MHRVALVDSQCDGRGGDVTVDQVVDVGGVQAVMLEEPGIIPPGTDIMNAPVGPVDEYDAGSVIRHAHPHLAALEKGPQSVPQHLHAPGIAAIAQGQGGVVGNAGSWEQVVGEVVITIGPADREVQGALRVDPIVLAAHSEGSVDPEA